MAQINKPSEHFNTKLYSGNGSTQSITGVGFKPDFTWIKGRSGTYNTENHNAYDSTRGVTKFLIPNGTTASTTDANSLTAFGTDGFSLGNRGDVNGASTEYASWNWKANGGTTSSNTDGSITSTVQANTTAGFSIVSYTGTGSNATVGHGLGSAPKVIIVKGRSFVDSWGVYHYSIGNGKNVKLNSNGGQNTSSTHWQDTDPTSSVFSIGTNTEINTSSATFIAYCFAEKKGYSKFGSYTGIASSDSNFVYLGFKPSLIIIKNASAASTNWHLYDNKRLGYNVDNNVIQGNTSSAELTNDDIDFLSNGFKLRRSTSSNNGSGNTMIYMAFAEQPLVGTNNIPATAR